MMLRVMWFLHCIKWLNNSSSVVLARNATQKLASSFPFQIGVARYAIPVMHKYCYERLLKKIAYATLFSCTYNYRYTKNITIYEINPKIIKESPAKLKKNPTPIIPIAIISTQHRTVEKNTWWTTKKKKKYQIINIAFFFPKK